MEIVLRGIGVSPGIAIGPALTFGVQTLDIPKYTIEDPAAEKARFEKAVRAARKELKRLQDRTAKELGAHHANIFSAQILMLEDVTLHDEIDTRLESERLNAEFLLDDMVGRYTALIQSMDDPRFRERAQDLVDVGQRILGKLLNAELATLERLERPSIIVAHDLSPSDTAKIDLENALGIATDVSGPTSHTAILARAFEIPAVVGLRYVGSHVLSGDTIIIDGSHGMVVIRPEEATLTKYKREKRALDARRKALLAMDETRMSVTLDGHQVPTRVNIELPVEISHSLKAKAQGVGLYRTEYLYLNRNTLPSEEEQFQAYSEVAEAMKPHPVTLRTLDVGGDKLVSHLRGVPELNPQLGWRAIRFCLERPDIFKAQLRAMLRASVHGNIQIMFPLISGVGELRQVKEVFRDVCAELERRGVSFDKKVKVGSMIEVPSAVAVADLLARECDFFSLGTNDLIQYSLAVDRGNEKIAHMYEPAHPAILRMIAQTVKAAKAAGIPCALCGEMAGDPIFTELLVGLGVDSLSMSSVSIPVVRAQIAGARLSLARRFARRVLSASTSVETLRMLGERYRSRNGDDE